MDNDTESESDLDDGDEYARALLTDPEFARFMARVVASAADGKNGHFQRMYTVDDAVAEKMIHENKRVENRFMWATKQPKNLAALLDKYVIIHKGVPNPRMLCVARLAEWGWAPDMREWLRDHDPAQLAHAARGPCCTSTTSPSSTSRCTSAASRACCASRPSSARGARLRSGTTACTRP